MSRLASLAWAALGGGTVAAALLASGQLNAPAEHGAEVAKTAEHEALDPLPAERAQAGITVKPLQAASVASPQRGFARSVDVAALAAIDADYEAARVAASASRAEWRRLQALYTADQSASLRSVEAARAQALGDGLRADAALRRVGLEFGAGLTRLGAGGVQRLVADVASGRAALLRIDIAGAVLIAGQRVDVGDGDETTSVTVLGPAATADPRLQTPGVLAIVRGAAAQRLPVGRIVPASVAGGTVKNGVLIPRSAIVRWQGARWVYRQTASGFERVALQDGERVEAGWLVTQGLSVGDRVAVTGAGSLLAAERGGEAEAE